MKWVGRINSALRRDPGLTQLLSIAVTVKLTILLIVFLAYHLLPFCTPCYQANFTFPQGEAVTASSAFKTWDGHHYSYLAEAWYRPGHISNAFYPLYPLLVKALKPLFLSHALAAGIVLSNLLSLAAMALLYRFAKLICDERSAFYSCLLFLTFPTSFYTSLMYSEALFLFLVLLLFYGLYRDRVGPALIASFLLPLARPQGILVLVPLAVHLMLKVPVARGRSFDRRYALPWGFLAGFSAYLLIMKSATGSYLAGFAAQKGFVAQNTLANFLHPWKWFSANFIDVPFALHGFTNSVLDRLFFVLFLATLVPIYRRLDKTLFAYTAVLGLVVAVSGSFMAYSRYLLVLFPMFIASGQLFKDRHYFLSIPFAALQILFLIAHCLNYWIA